jgi:3-dehydroquinate dehydratase
MKKLLLSATLLSSLAIMAPAAEAKTTALAVEAPQIRVQIGNNRNRNRFRRVRVVTSTRIVGFGRNRYREVIRTTYLPNGRTRTQVISRQRIGWNRG